MFVRVQSTMSKHSGNGLVPNRRQAIIWTNNGQDIWRHMASLGGNELTPEQYLNTEAPTKGQHCTGIFKWVPFKEIFAISIAKVSN